MGNSSGENGGSVFDLGNMIQSLFVETDFESHSHPDMEQMIKSADPDKPDRMGEKLHTAAKKIHKIGNELKTHGDHVVWESKAGDSFREWLHQMAKATLQLGDKAKGAGADMKHVAQTLREVQRDMPPYSASAKSHVDAFLHAHPGKSMHDLASAHGDASGNKSEKAASAAAKLNEDHGEAVRQMRKLAQSYTMSSMSMSQAKTPSFPPVPHAFLPPKPVDDRHGVKASDLPDKTASNTSSTAAADSAPKPHSHSESAHPDSQVGTDIAGGVVTPKAPHAPSHTGMPGPTPGDTGLGGRTGPYSAPISPLMRPPAVTGKAAPPSTTNRPPAAPSAGRARPLLPKEAGTTRLPGSKLPGGPRDGIYGGRPSTAQGTPMRGIPRGTVVGSEEGQQGGRMMGRTGAFGAGGSAGAGRAGVVGGSPRAIQPGGEVGGPQEPAASRAGRAFTPGGSGLVRNTTAEETNAIGGRGPGGSPVSSHHRTNGSRPRPEYLIEDENTWSQRNSTVVPPVIE